MNAKQAKAIATSAKKISDARAEKADRARRKERDEHVKVAVLAAYAEMKEKIASAAANGWFSTTIEITDEDLGGAICYGLSDKLNKEGYTCVYGKSLYPNEDSYLPWNLRARWED